MNNHSKRAYAAFKSGVMIAAGSDAGVIEHGTNSRELEWYVKIGLSEREALGAATLNTAKLLGMENQIGSIETGKIADIIAVHKSPLEDIKNLQNIKFVMKKWYSHLS